ncbi:hypothetical protein PAXRUDRAFT_834255 [Paxillus rubicundulus Ve08.2h10]|uniref:Uncharacterized protein n=1 Tax=Paxillus rubicundulus Ve08.2h10 TaxID=930991 RepID=A0A0D0CUK1_9AGAM|nr:hypothetical protein PAXRUDRAFT_834255 [Paxillus rubicundulus Ve08.2h10]
MSSVAASFTITLQKGITGGFAPPTPSALYTLTRTPENATVTVVSQIRPPGTPSLQDPVTTTFLVEENATTLKALHHILSSIPPQYPGAQDLYGFDTSIVYRTGEAVAQGVHIYGSAAGYGVTPPTEKEKGEFQQAVDIIMGLVA